MEKQLSITNIIEALKEKKAEEKIRSWVDVSKEINIDNSTLNRIVGGQTTNPTEDTISKIMIWLGRTESEFLEDIYPAETIFEFSLGDIINNFSVFDLIGIKRKITHSEVQSHLETWKNKILQPTFKVL